MKGLLLDSHALLWSLAEPARLGVTVRRRIEAPGTPVYVSVISGWELELKRSLGKLELPDDLDEQLEAKRFTELPLRFRHVTALRELPSLHRDPFDRILVAQAIADGLTIVSHDERVLAYPVKSLRI